MTFQLKFSNFNQKSDRIMKMNLSNFILVQQNQRYRHIFYSLTSLFWSEHSAYITHNAPRYSLVGQIAGLAASEMVSFSTFSVPDSLVKFSDFVQ